MSRWEKWSRGEKEGPKFLGKFMKEAQMDLGNPTGTGSPAERARQLGLQSDGSGGYIDPETGQVVARTVNGELVFYDNRGIGGGAVTDGAGGKDLANAQPTWSDPMTGMAITPPSRPESPSEVMAIPDPIPATAPAGYDSFMNQTRQQMYQQSPTANATANVNNPMQAAPAPGINPVGPAGGVDMGPGEGLPGVNEDVGDNANMNKLAGKLPPVVRGAAAMRRQLQKGNPDLAQQSLTPQAAPEPEAQPQVQPQATPEPEAQEETPVMNAVREKLLTAIQTMNSGGGRQKAGIGGLKLNPEDLDKLENYIRNGAQNERVDLSDEDFEWAKGQLDESLGGKRSRLKGFVSKLNNKGSVPKDLQVNNRGDRVLRSYLENLGQSAIDGSPLALSESDLDHHRPLADGGVDDGENWRWLPRRFNNFKKDFEDDVLLERIQKQRDRDPLDDELKDKLSSLQNDIRSAWRSDYGERGWDHLNIADLKELKGGPGMQKLKALANAASISTTTAEGVKPGSRTPNRTKTADELRDEIIETLGIPEQHDIETWDRSLFELLDKFEGRRSDVDSLNIKKKARDADKRKQARAEKLKSLKEQYLDGYTRERVDAFRKFRAKYE